MMAVVHPKLEVRFRKLITELAEIASTWSIPVTSHGAPARSTHYPGDHPVTING
jgi:hypothetical protein